MIKMDDDQDTGGTRVDGGVVGNTVAYAKKHKSKAGYVVAAVVIAVILIAAIAN